MKRVVLFSLMMTLVVAACSDQGNPAQPDTEPQMAMVPVSVAAAPAINTLTITVSASDIASDLVFNVTMTNGEATDTITIPAGSDRTITVRGYDASNIETHRGSKTVNLTEGVNPQLTVVLEGLTGDQPLVVALGETTVTVSPETATVSVGGTTQLSAVVTDEAGDTLAVSVRWASTHPAVATVDDAGLVSGVSVGSASIIATYGGVGASAAVTVSDAVFPTEGLVAWYPFNGNANDESGNATDGQVFGATLTPDRFGVAASAYYFDGASRIEFLQQMFEGSTAVPQFTLSLWAVIAEWPAGTETTTSVLYSKDGFWQLIAMRASSDGTLSFGGSQPNPQGYYGVGSQASTLAADGLWHHYLVTFDAGVIRVLVDGIEVASTTTTYTSLDWSQTQAGNCASPCAHMLGALESGTLGLYGFLIGAIDEFALWERVLSSEEIAYLANN